MLRDDGKTACGCWIYSGCFTEAGNNMARRDNTDPDDAGVYPNWAFVVAGQPAHPLQPRLGRHERQAVGSERKLIEWDGAKWTGYDVPDIAPTVEAGQVGRAVHHEPGRHRRGCSRAA